MGCVKKVGRDSNALSGDGAFTWGNIHEVTPKEKSLLELFWGLFTGFFVSPDVESPIVTDIFPERLVMPRKRNAPDGLTIWVRRSFVPFYDQMEKKYPPPLSIKYRKYVILPWVMLVFTWLIPVSFWHLFLRQWHKAFPTQASPSDVEKKSSDASIYGTTSHDSNETSNSDTSAQSQVLENLTEYSGAWILRVTSIMTTVVACLLPTVAITVLAKVHSMGLILGLITLFTALFAFGLVLLSSSSSRVEIFTATAAYASLELLFINLKRMLLTVDQQVLRRHGSIRSEPNWSAVILGKRGNLPRLVLDKSVPASMDITNKRLLTDVWASTRMAYRKIYQNGSARWIICVPLSSKLAYAPSMPSAPHLHTAPKYLSFSNIRKTGPMNLWVFGKPELCHRVFCSYISHHASSSDGKVHLV